MTGRAILKIFLKLIHLRYNLNIPDFDLQIDSDFVNLNDAFQLIDRQETAPYQGFIQCFAPDKVGAQFLDDEYPPANRLEYIDFSNSNFIKRKRSFGFSDVQFGYVSLTELFTWVLKEPLDTTGEEYKTLVDFVATSICNNDIPTVNQLFDYLTTKNENIGLLIHKIAHANNSLSVYSYIYYKDLLRGNQLSLDPQLNYTLSHGAIVNFTNGIIYEQYFEVFDIINELNHSADIISRFLKLYHILEYLIYRVELVEIEKKARINRSFVREMHGLAGKSQSDKEFDILKRNFNKIFSTEILAGAFNLTLTLDQSNFIRDHFSIASFVHTEASSISTLIYRIRNSIVHNKESEFHLTSTNPDEYLVIIPVIKELIQKLERTIFDKISLNASVIRYQSSNIQLY